MSTKCVRAQWSCFSFGGRRVEEVISDMNINESTHRRWVSLPALTWPLRQTWHCAVSPHTPLRNNYCSSCSSSQMVRAFRVTPHPIPPSPLSLSLPPLSVAHCLFALSPPFFFFFTLRLFLSLLALCSLLPHFASTNQQFNLNPLHISHWQSVASMVTVTRQQSCCDSGGMQGRRKHLCRWLSDGSRPSTATSIREWGGDINHIWLTEWNLFV